MDERVRFVGRLLDGESIREVCREFGISRKTGYKIWDCFRQEGLEALTDRSRRPVRYANQLPDPIERRIVATKRPNQVIDRTTWYWINHNFTNNRIAWSVSTITQK